MQCHSLSSWTNRTIESREIWCRLHWTVSWLLWSRLDLRFFFNIPIVPGLFYLLGIDKWAIMNSLAIVDGDFHYSQIASNPSYVPSAGGILNTFRIHFNSSNVRWKYGRSDVIQWKIPQFSYFTGHKLLLPTLSLQIYSNHETIRPNNAGNWGRALTMMNQEHFECQELFSQNSLVFMNSEPLVDFPRVNSARIIDIGGISVSEGHKQLNQVVYSTEIFNGI